MKFETRYHIYRDAPDKQLAFQKEQIDFKKEQTKCDAMLQVADQIEPGKNYSLRIDEIEPRFDDYEGWMYAGFEVELKLCREKEVILRPTYESKALPPEKSFWKRLKNCWNYLRDSWRIDRETCEVVIK